jgi:acyl-CoA thioester hydrolase
MSDFDPLNPEAYRFWADEHVRFADLDMQGHVNNKAYATYFESGRIAYFTKCGINDGPKAGMVMVRLEIDYRKEITFPAGLRVGVRPLKLTRSTLTVGCAIFNGDICSANSISTSIRFDPVARRSMPFSDAERVLIEADL